MNLACSILRLGLCATFCGALFADPPSPKHRRGEGLLPQKPANQNIPKGNATPSQNLGRPLDKKTPRSSAASSAPKEDEGETETVRPCTTPPLLEKLFAQPDVSVPNVASAGAYFLRTVNGHKQVHLQVTASSEPMALTAFAGGVATYKASPSGKAFLALTPSGANQSMHFWSAREGKPVALVEGQEKIVSAAWSADESFVVFTSNRRSGDDFDLYRYDFSAKTVTLLAPLSGYNEVRDISPNGKLVAIVSSSSPQTQQIRIWKKETPLKTVGMPSYVGDLAFSADSEGLFFQSNQGKQAVGLYFAPLKNTVLKKVTSESELLSFGLDSRRRNIVFVAGAAPSKLGGFGLTENGTTGAQLKVPAKSGTVFDAPAVIAGNPGGTFFFARSKFTRPAQLWFWNRTKAELWTHLEEMESGEGCLAKGTVTRIGENREVFLFRPPKSEGKIPFVIYTRTESLLPGFDPTIQYLTLRGFGVLAPTEGVRAETAQEWLIKEKQAVPEQIFAFEAAAGSDELKEVRLAVETFEAGMKKGPR